MKITTYLSALLSMSLFASVAFAAGGHKHDSKTCPFNQAVSRKAMDLNHDKIISEAEFIQFSKKSYWLHVDNMDKNNNLTIDENEWWNEFSE